MATGSVRLSDLPINTEYQALTENIILETKTRLGVLNSGIAISNPDLDAIVASQGMVFQVPFYKDLDDDEERISNDSSAVFNTADASANAAGSGTSPERLPNPNKISSGVQIGVKLNRNQSWSSTNLAAELVGHDPLQAIMSRIAAYWERRIQIALIAVMKGVIADNTANDSGDYTHDVSGASFIEGVTNITAESFIDATTTLGDAKNDLKAIAVHSIVYGRMQKNNLIDYIPDSMGVFNIPVFLGHRVIVDDSVPSPSSGVYESWLFGSGLISLSVVSPKQSPGLEMSRIAGGGNGAGQDVLYSRKSLLIHPNYHSYIGSTTLGGGPANSVLDDAASWNRVATERKQVPFARLLTREF